MAAPEHNFSDEQVQELKEAFTIFDKSGNGQVTTKDIGLIMKGLGLDTNETELQDMLAEVDSDSNGAIDFPEFLGMLMRKMRDGEADEELRAAFNFLDKDKDGKISKSDLKSILQTLGEKVDDGELDEMMSHADLDKDGLVNYQEFIAMMNSH